MNRGIALLGGLGLGACLMYFFDPDRGVHRRASIRRRLAGFAHVDSVRDAFSSHVGHRATAPVEYVFRKLQSFVATEHEDVRDELH